MAATFRQLLDDLRDAGELVERIALCEQQAHVGGDRVPPALVAEDELQQAPQGEDGANAEDDGEDPVH